MDMSLISKTEYYKLDFEIEGCLSAKRYLLSSLTFVARGNGSFTLQPLSTIDAQVASGSVALLHPLATVSFCTVESSSNVKNNMGAGYF